MACRCVPLWLRESPVVAWGAFIVRVVSPHTLLQMGAAGTKYQKNIEYPTSNSRRPRRQASAESASFFRGFLFCSAGEPKPHDEWEDKPSCRRLITMSS